MFIRKKEAFKFSGREHSLRGMLSVVIGCLSVIGFIILSMISGLNEGNGGLILGAIGIVLFFLSIAGFSVGIKATKEKEIYYTAPTIGIIVNGILAITYFILYMIGTIL